MTISSRSRGLGGIFSRKKSTYGLILPDELFHFSPDQKPPVARKYRRNTHFSNKVNGRGSGASRGSKDCFAPSQPDSWQLPQYESLFNHLIAEDGTFRRRLSSSASSGSKSKTGEDTESLGASGDGGNNSGPVKRMQKWFREIINSLMHHSGEYDFGGDAAVDGIPVDVCEKLQYVHIYY